MKLDRAGIRKLIDSGNWSGVSLSKELGISRSWFIELMKGKRELKHSLLTAHLNVKIKQLLKR